MRRNNFRVVAWVIMIEVFALMGLMYCDATSRPNWEASTNDSLDVKLANRVRIQIHIQSDKSQYQSNDTATFTLSITSLEKKRVVELHYVDSQQYDFELFDADGRRVWWFGGETGFFLALTTVRIAPGETKVYKYKLPLAFPPGEYVLVGWLPFRDNDMGIAGPSVQKTLIIVSEKDTPGKSKPNQNLPDK